MTLPSWYVENVVLPMHLQFKFWTIPLMYFLCWLTVVTCCICWCPTKNRLLNRKIAQNMEERLLIHLVCLPSRASSLSYAFPTPLCMSVSVIDNGVYACVLAHLVVSEWIRWPIQVALKRFLWRMAEFSLRKWGEVLCHPESRGAAFSVEMSQMRWLNIWLTRIMILMSFLRGIPGKKDYISCPGNTLGQRH